MARFLRLAIAATLAFALRAEAQQDSADVLVYSGSFTAGSREFARIFLQKGQVYRAEVNLGEVSFTIRPRHPGGEPPTIARIRGGVGSGESVYEIYPFRDDEYEVTVADFPEGENASLRIYRDIVASRRRQGVIAGRPSDERTTVGLEFGVGTHGNYHISPLDEGINEQREGADFEGCLVISGTRHIWGCLIGVSVHRASDSPRILWFFVEPRFKVAAGNSGVRPELGLLVRGAFGTADEQSGDIFGPEGRDNPAFLAAGAYLRIWLGSERGKGLSLGVSGFHAMLFGAESNKDQFDRFGAALSFGF